MKTRTQLDEQSFEQLLAAAYLLQQQREALPLATNRRQPAMNEAERLAGIAEAQAIVHRNQLSLQQRLQLVAERAQRIVGGAGAAIWLLRGSQAVCQFACGVSAPSAGQSLGLEGSRLTACLRDGAIFRCTNAKSDPRTRYDALPGVAEGSVVAVPIHYEGRVQGALEVTFAQAWGFEDVDVRTCQILSGLISETVIVAAGRVQKDALESERATLLDALERLQPHLSKLLNDNGAGSQGWISERSDERRDDAMGAEDAVLPPTGSPVVSGEPSAPTHGLARLGKYLLDQKEQPGTSGYDAGQDAVSRPAAREVHTALNLSVTGQQPDTGGNRAGLVHPENEREIESDSPALEPEEQPYSRSHAYLYDEYESQAARLKPLTPADEPWLYEDRGDRLQTGPSPTEAKVPEAEPPQVRAGFWRRRGADACLAASAVLLAASLIWAIWPQPKKAVAQANAPAAVSEPKLSPLEELLVSMGLAEAPPPPATYTGTPGTRVWVDVNSALYYCPGAEPYGKTPKGKFLTQRDAQDEQFQPARGQPCE